MSGPGGFFQSVTGSLTLQGLVPGSYLISAAGVSSGGTNYTPAPLNQTVSVSAGASSAGAVTYAASGGGSLRASSDSSTFGTRSGRRRRRAPPAGSTARA